MHLHSGSIRTLAVIWWVLATAPANARVRVYFNLPQVQMSQDEAFTDDLFVDEDSRAEELSPTGRIHAEVVQGAILEVPVVIEDEADDVVSYAFRIVYPKKLLRIIEIRGGLFDGFADTPLTNPRTFTSGKTDFTAQNAGFRNTPNVFHAATVVFQVIGEPEQKGSVGIHKTPRSEVVLKKGFRSARQVAFRRMIFIKVKN